MRTAKPQLHGGMLIRTGGEKAMIVENEKLIVDILLNLTKATEGLLHRTQQLAEDQSYNDSIRREILDQRHALERISQGG
jgi:hypothetical protein